MNRDRETATRSVELAYDAAANRMEIVYNPDNTGGSRTRLAVQPWAGVHEFIVDESASAGCDRWLIRVRVEWDAQAALAGGTTCMQVRYGLEDFDCRNLAHADGHRTPDRRAPG